MTPKCPDYILVVPKENGIPEVMASCEKQDFDKLKDMKIEGMFIFRRVGR